MDSFCVVSMPATAPAAEVAAQMADATAAGHDGAKLRRALIAGGSAKAAAALLLALSSRSSPPAGGVFHRGGGTTLLLCAYYGVLAAVALFGGVEVAVGFWVAGDPDRRRGWGRRVIWVSVVPLVIVAGLGGFAVLK
ncbi:hypothetical protein BDA96_06G216400 [Sorghum bicolor]|jgi:hypothetical protein|uniref:Uncharacterized protein n=2 Tax=Sorghum bicolor TaxID=4558 RepID=C5YF06_SORBI|nr:uncharacterized protein LOC8060471 [Sorghum bicolor]EES12756.1 hypothetical protein SORBI_3006G198000 [Sorghum bicolor]KAG0527239.1 hypothetical protein BDA96_06G216400 [Sorghum bicolor]|eukprot:XP_002448428.1 uncharacterized protein LOC8060471 [Sorghum bicolor]